MECTLSLAYAGHWLMDYHCLEDQRLDLDLDLEIHGMAAFMCQ
jgi:hypothetical protein